MPQPSGKGWYVCRHKAPRISFAPVVTLQRPKAIYTRTFVQVRILRVQPHPYECLLSATCKSRGISWLAKNKAQPVESWHGLLMYYLAHEGRVLELYAEPKVSHACKLTFCLRQAG